MKGVGGGGGGGKKEIGGVIGWEMSGRRDSKGR